MNIGIICTTDLHTLYIKFYFLVNGAKDDIGNWYWCCEKARFKDHYGDRLGKFTWGFEQGLMSHDEKMEWWSRKCDDVVGGQYKAKCKLGKK